MAVVLPATSEDVACIMGMQYTIRSVPAPLDRAVRERAGREGKSINAVVVEALARGLDLRSASAHHTDLDHLIGTGRKTRRWIRRSLEGIDEPTRRLAGAYIACRASAGGSGAWPLRATGGSPSRRRIARSRA